MKPILSSYYYRFLISYVIMLVLPLLVISIVFYNYLLKEFESELIEKNNSNLEVIRNNVDTQLQELDNIAYQISRSPMFQTSIQNESYAVFIDVINQLYVFNSTNNFIVDLAFYPRHGNLIFTSETSSRIDIYTNDIWNYTLWETKEFNKALYAENKIWRGSEKINRNHTSEGNYLTVVYPLMMTNYYKPDATLLIQLDELFLKNLINSDSTSSSDFDFIIVNTDGELIYRLNESSSIPISSLVSASTKTSLSKNHFYWNKDTYSLLTTSSSYNGWKYISLSPIHLSMGKLEGLRDLFALALLLIIILGGGFSILFSRMNYNPLRQLRMFIQSSTGEISNNKNEIEAAKESILVLQRTKEEVVKKGRESMKQAFIFKLLNGEFEKLEDMKKEGSLIGYSEWNKYLRVIYVVPEQNDNSSIDKEHISEIMLVELGCYYTVYSGVHLDSTGIILILSAEDTDDIMLREVLSSLISKIFNECNNNVFVSVGGAYTGVNEVLLSYMEATDSSKYRLINGSNNIIFYSEICNSHREIFVYPKLEIEALREAIQLFDSDRIQHILNDLIRLITHKHNSLFAAICLSYDIINTLLKGAEQLESDIISTSCKKKDFLQNQKFNSIEDITKIIEQLGNSLCEQLRKNNNCIVDFEHKVQQFIKRNYDDPSFSIQAIAEQLGLSLTTLSRQYKNRTGQNIKDYISNLRLEKAKELLVSTEQSVSEVSKAIGYLSENSFINKFKQIEGITPGTYRKTYSKVSNLK